MRRAPVAQCHCARGNPGSTRGGGRRGDRRGRWRQAAHPLIRLALDAGRTVTADLLSHALWPEEGPTDRANALQSLVSRLRQTLPGTPVVRSDPGGYRLELPPEAVDALRFERLAREGRRALRDRQAGIAARRLREALGLWRGEALADVAEAPFAAAAVVRLSELRLGAIEDRIEAELQSAPEHSHLVAELEELAALHPLRERLRVLLVKALHADGRQAEALTAYEEFRRLLADELGADPGPELQDAHLAALRGEKAPEPASSTRPRGNLRVALTSFVGRAEEQARIRKQLKEGRLVTLVGPGGAGKTRLATTFAATIADGVPGGAWLVELAPVTDPADVTQAVVGALGLREVGWLDTPTASRDPLSRLVEALSAVETLIVLDNCEHVIDGTARLVDDLLGRCPRLRVLATSREPLGILGEALCPVPPLGLPEPGASADEAPAYPAARLFADRAAAAQPDFSITDDNVAAVSEICRRLDGLPLAIELATARLSSLPVEEVAARLGDRFRLLTGGSRTVLPRHQTLRAAVGWSWDLLDDDERGVAERLAVFPATISPEAAGQVCAVSPSAFPTVLDALAALADKSLLQKNTSSRLGNRSESSLTPIPVASSRRMVSEKAASESTGTVRAPGLGDSGSRKATVRRIPATSSSRSGFLGWTAMAWPPTTCLSSAGVPCAMTRPWSMTATSSASASASSRYWVVSSTVTPSAVIERTMRHTSSRLAGSRPVVGSSRKMTPGRPTRLAARSRRRRMPPE